MLLLFGPDLPSVTQQALTYPVLLFGAKLPEVTRWCRFYRHLLDRFNFTGTYSGWSILPEVTQGCRFYRYLLGRLSPTLSINLFSMAEANNIDYKSVFMHCIDYATITCAQGIITRKLAF